MRKRTTPIVLAVGLALGSPRSSAADNTTAANAQFLNPGQVQATSFSATDTTRWYKTGLTAGRSYAVCIWAPDTDPSETAVSLDINYYEDDGVAFGATGVFDIGISAEPLVQIAGHTGDCGGFRPTVSGTYRFRIIASGATASFGAEFAFVETTLFSPWFFAAGGYEGYIEVKNNTSSARSVTVTAHDPTGATLGTTTVSIPADGNTFVTASSLGAVGSGSVQIAHNGFAGAISANITTLNPATGLSFDAPFTPRMAWSSFGNYWGNSDNNTTAANANFLFPGKVVATTLSPATTAVWYKVGLTAGRSYAVCAWGPEHDPSEANVSLDLDYFMDDGVTAAAGAVDNGSTTEPRIQATDHFGDCGVVRPASSGTYRLRLDSVAVPTAQYDVHVSFIETTLFAPWVFVSAAAGYEGFIEIRNDTASTRGVTVTVYAASGAVAGTTTLTLPANGNTFVAASSLGLSGPGSAQITHDGPAGAISANITTLSAMTGLSFDAPFTPRMQAGLYGNLQ